MADTWGGITLNVTEYKRPTAKRYLIEKELLPAYDAHSTDSPNTVIMGTGRYYRRREIQGWTTREDYLSLKNDKNAASRRTLTFDDGYTLSAIIEKLEGNEQVGYDIVWYTATFIEAVYT